MLHRDDLTTAADIRLQFFLSESRWDPERVSARRLELNQELTSTTSRLTRETAGRGRDGLPGASLVAAPAVRASRTSCR